MIAIIYKDGGSISRYDRGIEIKDYMIECSQMNDDAFGAGNWTALDTDELPADFSVDTYTIIDGALVPASDEVIAARAAAKIAEQNAAIREKRRQLYDDPNGECAQLYWDWQEAQSPEAFAAWVAAKNEIRKQNPYIDANN